MKEHGSSRQQMVCVVNPVACTARGAHSRYWQIGPAWDPRRELASRSGDEHIPPRVGRSRRCPCRRASSYERHGECELGIPGQQLSC